MTPQEKSKIQKEIVASLPSKPHGRLLLAPRVGKSKLAIDIIKREKPKSILWVTPSAELAENDIPKEFEIWKAKKYLNSLTTVTWTSLNTIEGFYDMIILDEEQFATENNLVNFFETPKITYNTILSMTGTPTKHENKLELYKKLNLDVLYDLSINEAVDMGLLSNYDIKVVEVSLGTERNVLAGNKANPFMTTEVGHYEYLTKQVNKAMFAKNKFTLPHKIMERVRFIKNAKSKTEAAKKVLEITKGRKLIFAGTIAQAEELCQNTFHSETTNEDLKLFQKGEINSISMVNSGGTGFTYKEIDHLILVQSDSDKNGLTSQKLCRTLLSQKGYKATIWIICLVNTQDQKWVQSALESFDKSKVQYIHFKNLGTLNNINGELDMFKKHGVSEIKMGSKNYKI